MSEPRRITARVPEAVRRLRERRRGPGYWFGVSGFQDRAGAGRVAHSVTINIADPAESRFADGPMQPDGSADA
jgi:hypothetical protein